MSMSIVILFAVVCVVLSMAVMCGITAYVGRFLHLQVS